MTLFVGGEPDLLGESLLTETELAVYVGAFRHTGFAGPLNWYRNHGRNWRDTEGAPDRVDIPALMVSADGDLFLRPETSRGMEVLIPDLERRVIKDCGHWTQQERPDETNAILLDWLERRMRAPSEPGQVEPIVR
jgi:pimeloyl-ACP methyl ester carboxylesterase